MAYSTRFWNRIAKKYAASPIPNEGIYQQKLTETRKYLTNDMRVLEFGCGTGSTALVHAPYVKHYHAIDVSPGMIDIAKDKLAQSDLSNLEFSVVPMEEFSSSNVQYDVILGLSILHLMASPQAVIQQVYQMLKPGGLFISSTACINEFMPWFRFVAPIGGALGLIPKLQYFSRQELLAMLEGVGFKTIYELEREKKSQACFFIMRK